MEFFSFTFIINALAAGAMASITCGIIGTYIMARRMVFISGGISHSAFGGIGIAGYLGTDPVLGAGVFALLTSAVIEHLRDKRVVNRDSAIGIMWSVGMAAGIVFVALTPGYSVNLMTYLFGNILTVSRFDLILMGVTGLIVLLFFTFLYQQILTLSFDEEFALSRGVRVKLMNYLLSALVALTIVVHIKVVGIILVISLLTIPQTTASLFKSGFCSIMIFSSLLGIVSSFAGIWLSFVFNIPSGASIIIVSALLFVLVKLFVRIRRQTV